MTIGDLKVRLLSHDSRVSEVFILREDVEGEKKVSPASVDRLWDLILEQRMPRPVGFSKD